MLLSPHFMQDIQKDRIAANTCLKNCFQASAWKATIPYFKENNSNIGEHASNKRYICLNLLRKEHTDVP